MDNLRKKTFYGVFWSYINRFSLQILSIVPAMILTRMLSPDQYGLIAMASIFTGLAYQLADGGFGNALVQKKNADVLDFNTVFYFNIVAYITLYLLTYFAAPLISLFFHEEALTNIIRVSSIGLIFVSFGSVQAIIFKKNIDYKKPTIRNISCQILSVIVAVSMAFMGLGVWSLVFQGLVYTLLASILNWILCTWKPSLQFSFVRLRKLFNFGSKTLLSSMIDYGFSKAYDIVIGRVYSPSALALYNRAFSTQAIFTGTFFSVFSGVTFPVFVQMQDDNERLILNIRKFLIVITMLIFSVMSTLIVLANPLFEFLYSSKWDGAIPFFQLACISGMITPLISIMESIILAKGFSGKFLIISIVRKCFVVVALFVAWHFGITWLIVGQIIVNICELSLYLFYIKRIVGFGISNLLNDITPYFIIAIIVAFNVFVCNFALKLATSNVISGMTLSCIELLLGSIVATLTLFLVNRTFKTRGYFEFVQFLEDSIGRNRFVRMLKI